MSAKSGWLIARPVVCLLLAAMWCGLPLAAQPPRNAGHDAAAPAQVAQWLELLPADHRNVGVAWDLLPVIQGAIDASAVQAVLQNPAWTALFAMDNNVPALAPDQWSRQLEGVAMWWPEEVAFAWPDGSVAQVGRWIELYLAASLQTGALATGDDETANALYGPIQDLVKGLDVPRMTMMVRFRDAVGANTVAGFGMMGLGQASQQGLSVDVQPDGMRLYTTLAEFAEPWMVLEGLKEVGVFPANARLDEPAVAALIDTLMHKPAELWFHQAGEVLMLTLGPRPGPDDARLDVAALGEQYRAQPDDLMFGRAGLRGLRDALDRAVVMWERYEDTPAGGWVRAVDDEGGLTDLYDVQDFIASSGDVVAGRIWKTPHGLSGAYQVDGVAAPDSLEASGLLSRLPEGTEAFYGTQLMSLTDFLDARLTKLETRLFVKEVGAELGHNADQLGLYQRVAAGYFEHFSAFRNLVLLPREGPFEVPAAVLYRFVEAPQRVTVTIGDPSLPAEQRETVTFASPRSLEVAWVGRVSDHEQASAHVEQLMRTFIDGVTGAVGAPPYESDGLLPALRLPPGTGPGVPVHGFDTGWVPWVSLEVGTHLAVDFDGTMVPHSFFLDDYWVLSTSPGLSREIAESWAAQASRPALPTTPRPATTWLNIDRDAFTATADWMGEFVGSVQVNGQPHSGRSMTSLGLVFEAVGDLLALIGHAELVEWGTDAGRVGRFEVVFEAP